jgi:hypothetical protein
MLVDTFEIGSHAYDYTYPRARGFWFQAKSSFNIVGVKAADGNHQGVNATHQSIEVIKFDTMPQTGSSTFNPHTVLFSAINIPHMWTLCNAQVDSGGYYGIIGAKNDSAPATTGGMMYNSYISGTLKLLLNGDSTVIHRAGIQLSLAFGSPQNGYYFDDGLHTLGRVHFMISADNTPQLQINQIGQNLDASVFGGLSPYTFYWSTGETTQTITPQTNGNYWLLVTDSDSCISDTVFYNFLSSNIYDIQINSFNIYPNPSRDIFNVSFVSDEVQNLEISIINVVGEAVYIADLDQFVGQFTKEVSLATYPKGVYFLEITTDKGVINKKLILQ